MLISRIEEVRIGRRQALALGGGLAVLAALGPVGSPAFAGPADDKLAEITKGKPLEKGRVSMELPARTDDGRFVHLAVAIDSPMTATDYVKALHVLAERNTLPEVASYRFTPASGKAAIITRIRIVRTQVVVAIAEMSDGSMHVAKAMCKVVGEGGACG